MFDYQAGEKFKLTLVMVGVAGAMAGAFFTMLLMPPAEAPKTRQRPAWMSNPDGQPRGGNRMAPMDSAGPGQGGAQAQGQAPSAGAVSSDMAKNLIYDWLPLAWDLSAGSADGSQAKAMQYMTPECAQAYRTNIWTPDLARQVSQSGLKSGFTPRKIGTGQTRPDGSIEVFVEGEQLLQPQGQPATTKPVKMEYLVKMTGEGLRIAGIQEGGG